MSHPPMKLELTIPSLAVFDTIVSGVEGGIRYWGRVATFWVPGRCLPTDAPVTDLRLRCEVVVHDTGEQIALNGKWATALQLMAENTRRSSPRFSRAVVIAGLATASYSLQRSARSGTADGALGLYDESFGPALPDRQQQIAAPSRCLLITLGSPRILPA